MPRPSAFTLIELLITSVIFITVAGLGTAALISTVRIQQTVQQSQQVTQQLSSASKEIEHDVSTSSAVRIAQLSNNVFSTNYWPSSYPDDEMLLAISPRPDDQGGLTSVTDLHVYCAVPQQSDGHTAATGKILTRFEFPAVSAIPADVGTKPHICTGSYLSDLLGLPAPLERPLTDATIQSATVRFWPVWIDAYRPTNNPNSLLPPAVRMEITARQVRTNSASYQESRAVQSDLSGTPVDSPPLLFRQTFIRKQPYIYSQ